MAVTEMLTLEEARADLLPIFYDADSTAIGDGSLASPYGRTQTALAWSNLVDRAIVCRGLADFATRGGAIIAGMGTGNAVGVRAPGRTYVTSYDRWLGSGGSLELTASGLASRMGAWDQWIDGGSVARPVWSVQVSGPGSLLALADLVIGSGSAIAAVVPRAGTSHAEQVETIEGQISASRTSYARVNIAGATHPTPTLTDPDAPALTAWLETLAAMPDYAWGVVVASGVSRLYVRLSSAPGAGNDFHVMPYFGDSGSANGIVGIRFGSTGTTVGRLTIDDIEMSWMASPGSRGIEIPPTFEGHKALVNCRLTWSCGDDQTVASTGTSALGTASECSYTLRNCGAIGGASDGGNWGNWAHINGDPLGRVLFEDLTTYGPEARTLAGDEYIPVRNDDPFLPGNHGTNHAGVASVSSHSIGERVEVHARPKFFVRRTGVSAVHINVIANWGRDIFPATPPADPLDRSQYGTFRGPLGCVSNLPGMITLIGYQACTIHRIGGPNTYKLISDGGFYTTSNSTITQQVQQGAGGSSFSAAGPTVYFDRCLFVLEGDHISGMFTLLSGLRVVFDHCAFLFRPNLAGLGRGWFRAPSSWGAASTADIYTRRCLFAAMAASNSAIDYRLISSINGNVPLSTTDLSGVRLLRFDGTPGIDAWMIDSAGGLGRIGFNNHQPSPTSHDRSYSGASPSYLSQFPNSPLRTGSADMVYDGISSRPGAAWSAVSEIPDVPSTVLAAGLTASGQSARRVTIARAPIYRYGPWSDGAPLSLTTLVAGIPPTLTGLQLLISAGLEIAVNVDVAGAQLAASIYTGPHTPPATHQAVLDGDQVVTVASSALGFNTLGPVTYSPAVGLGGITAYVSARGPDGAESGVRVVRVGGGRGGRTITPLVIP